jgi:pimeloyl-ACP methyl ester carboxylesterase
MERAMPTDLPAFRDLQRRRDDDLGIEERFLQPVIGAGRTVAVLATPTRPGAGMGWVLCHSLGLEQIWFADLEVATARALAASGQPVLRFHGQGYGDSEGDAADIRVATHLQDARDAVDVLREQTGVREVGLLGARFGAAVALVVGCEIGAERVAMWDPVVDGPAYVRSLARTAAITMLTTAGEARDAALEALDEQDELDVSGGSLSKTLLDDVAAFAPMDAVASGRAPGRALLVQVSRQAEARPVTTQIADSLGAHGCNVELAVVADPGSRTWGNQRYRSTEHGRMKADTQTTLVAELVARTVRWAGDQRSGGVP